MRSPGPGLKGRPPLSRASHDQVHRLLGQDLVGVDDEVVVGRQFLVEAATLSTLGAVVGIGLGLGAAWVIQATTPLPAAVAPWSLVVATMLGLGVGIVSGVYPARRASRLDPIDALRQE